MKQRPLGACFGRTVNSGQFQVYFCLDQGEGLYDLWRAPCFQNSSENKKLLHLHTRLPSASLILRWFWKLLLLDTSRLLRMVPWVWSLQSLDSGTSGNGLGLYYGVLATRSFLCTTPVGTSRWRCEQVRLPRCDLHKPLKALNIYPQNSIKLFIKSNAWNLGSPWKYYHILPEVPESSAVWCVCIFRLLIFVYHRQEGIHVT